jgi:adenosylcobinamide kinase / adenosylcobinamide-phosphate guanylyltransferase
MTPGGLTLLLGGARSGKSDMAVELGQRWAGEVCFVATAVAFDDDMASRIDRHRFDRPLAWGLVEEPVDLAKALDRAGGHTFAIVDCLTVWVGTLQYREETEADIYQRTDDLLEAVAARSGPTVIVSNEVGLGLHPETQLGRHYRDILGRVNQRVAARADHAFLLVAGRALRLRDIDELW